jgi:hypothetical protein
VAYVHRASDAWQHHAEVDGTRPRRLRVKTIPIGDGAGRVVGASAGQHVEQTKLARLGHAPGRQELASDPIAVDQRSFQHEHIQAAAGEHRGQGAPRDPSADDHDIRFVRQGAPPHVAGNPQVVGSHGFQSSSKHVPTATTSESVGA